LKVATTEKLSCHPIATTRRRFENSLEIQKATFYGSFLFDAPLTDERCNYNTMIEYITIRKLKG